MTDYKRRVEALEQTLAPKVFEPKIMLTVKGRDLAEEGAIF